MRKRGFSKLVTMGFGMGMCLMLLGGCATQTKETSEGAVGEKTSDPTTQKFGLLAPTLQNEFYINIDNGLTEKCEELGWEYDAFSFDNDSAKAVSQIENMVTSGTTAILAMVSDSTCDDALKAAQEKGVTIIECGVETSVYDICINADQYAAGETIGDMAADWVDEKMGGKADVVIYTTYQNQDMQNRGQGIEDKFKKRCPDSNVLEVVDVGKDVVGAGTTYTEAMLQKYPEIDAIISYSDGVATESVEAAKAAGRTSDDFAIFGCDATQAALEYIANDDIMVGTCSFASIPEVVIDYFERHLDGEDFSGAPVVMDTYAVTAKNIDEYTSN